MDNVDIMDNGKVGIKWIGGWSKFYDNNSTYIIYIYCDNILGDENNEYLLYSFVLMYT